MKHDYDGPLEEVFYTSAQWDSFAFNQWLGNSIASPEAVEERLQVAHEMGLVIQGYTLSLTSRQRQVVELYCFEGLTQVEIAAALGISQATVSQHLMGKLRRGHHVGGAFRKLRKTIRKAAQRRAQQNPRHAEILAVFNELLDASITRRRASEIIGGLARSMNNDAPLEEK